jgi:hypothetical protein
MKLGDKVTAPCAIVRRRVVYDNPIGRPQYGRAWCEANCPVPITGMYIGYRTYANGIVHYDHDYGNYFEPTSYIKIALIVTDERKKPVPVYYSTMSHV